MNNPGLMIALIAVMIIGYIALKLLATKYFVGLYRRTGKNMANKPRQLLGFLAGTSLLVSVIAMASGEIILAEAIPFLLASAGLVALMLLANKRIGGKDIAWCTLYQLALGFCFVGRLLIWILEISLEIGGMICFGNSAKFTWHPFFFTIIRKDGSVVENKSANVVLNEDGGFEGSAQTAAKIEAQMNSNRIRQEQGSLEREMEEVKFEQQQAQSYGDSGDVEQQRINELQDRYDALEAKKRNS